MLFSLTLLTCGIAKYGREGGDEDSERAHGGKVFGKGTYWEVDKAVLWRVGTGTECAGKTGQVFNGR